MSEQNACFQQLKYVQTGNRSAQIPPRKNSATKTTIDSFIPRLVGGAGGWG